MAKVCSHKIPTLEKNGLYGNKREPQVNALACNKMSITIMVIDENHLQQKILKSRG